MEPTTSYLWRLAGEAVAVLCRATPGYEARLTQRASLILSGEPVADFNVAIIDAGPESQERLHQFGRVIHERNLPIIVFLTKEVSDQLAPVAHDLNLKYAGQIPLANWLSHTYRSGCVGRRTFHTGIQSLNILCVWDRCGGGSLSRHSNTSLNY